MSHSSGLSINDLEILELEPLDNITNASVVGGVGNGDFSENGYINVDSKSTFKPKPRIFGQISTMVLNKAGGFYTKEDLSDG